MLNASPEREDIPGMVQNETHLSRRITLRSAFDIRWLVVMVFGFALSLAYYGLLFWAVIALIRWLLGS